MSGRDAIRGYLAQTLICLLEALQSDNDWQSVTLEPDVGSEKVDILWQYPHKKVAVQVKSSDRISGPDAETYAKQLEESKSADEYRLVLLGSHPRSLSKSKPIGKVMIPKPINLSSDGWVEWAAHRLDAYLEKRSFPKVPSALREKLVRALVGELMFYSMKGTAMSRNDLDATLKGWVTAKLNTQDINEFIKEAAEIRQCKSLFGIEAKTELREALMKFYKASHHTITRKTIKDAFEYLTLEGADLAVKIPKLDYLFNGFLITMGLLFLFLSIALFLLMPETFTNSRSIWASITLLLIYPAATIGCFIPVKPFIRALRVRREIRRLREEDRSAPIGSNPVKPSQL